MGSVPLFEHAGPACTALCSKSSIGSTGLRSLLHSCLGSCNLASAFALAINHRSQTPNPLLLSALQATPTFHHEGKGCLTHMWFGGGWKGCDKTRIRIYVDGETSASIDMELYLGHGIGFGDESAPWGVARIGKTGSGASVYDTYRIPFGKTIRVTGQLSPDTTGDPQFWWIIRGTENLPVELGGVRLPDNARLKLYKLEDHTAQPLEEFSLCDVKGNGALYQVTMAAKGLR